MADALTMHLQGPMMFRNSLLGLLAFLNLPSDSNNRNVLRFRNQEMRLMSPASMTAEETALVIGARMSGGAFRSSPHESVSGAYSSE